jgi:hypothetical protein
MIKISIPVSKISSIIGKNAYETYDDVFNEFWKKYKPKTYINETKREIAQKIINNNDIIKNILKETIIQKPINSSEVNEIIEKTTEKIKNIELSIDDKSKIIEHFKEKICTSYGTRNEDNTACKIEKECNTILKKDFKIYTKKIFEIDKYEYIISGIIDRIEKMEDGTDVLIELKNRKNRLSYKLQKKDYIQVQVYLQLLNINNAKLIEQYNDKIKIFPIERDDNFWENEIKSQLESFCNKFYNDVLKIS